MSVLDSLDEQPAARSDGTTSGSLVVRGREVVFYTRKLDVPGLPSPIKRDAKGRVLPGQTLNPRGQIHSLRPLIEALTGDGEELVMHALEEMRGKPREIRYTLDGIEQVQVQVPTIADSRAARMQLWERGYGAVVKALEVSGAEGGPIRTESSGGQQDLSKLTPQELRTLISLMSKATPPSEETVDAELVPPQGSE